MIDIVRAANLRTSLGRIAIAVAWFGCALLLAFGGAGIVAGMSHQPGTPARAELTWVGDHEIGPRLTNGAIDLQKLTDDVDKLGDQEINALVGVNGGDQAAIRAAMEKGQRLLVTIEQETTDLRTKLAAIPGTGPGAEIRLGGIPLRRYETLTGALDATGGLRASWDKLTASSLAAIQLQTTLADHDAATGAAARLGSTGRFAPALAKLDESDDQIASARKQRDSMSATVDVTILSDWIDRNAQYDLALRKLYSLLRSSHGKATTAVQKASAAEAKARENLPRDTRGLIIIMADVARGGLNRAVIDIEDAKGRLSAAIDAFNAEASDDSGTNGGTGAGSGAGAGTSPGASASP